MVRTGRSSGRLVARRLRGFADARNKLLTLADNAEQYGEQFVRIESVTKAGAELRYFDLTNELVREHIRAFRRPEIASLYKSDVSATCRVTE